MKKFTILIVLALVLAMVTPCVYAAGTAGLHGPSTVRAGDTITVSFTAGGGIYGGSGAISYDAEKLTLQGYAQSIGGSWEVEFNGNNFVFYDNSMSSPIESSATIFTATFTVKENLEAGTEISVAATGVTVSDGTADSYVGTCTYVVQLAPPLSDNCQLGALTVSNATISPAFSADVTQYTASVPFSTSSLQVSATAADEKATVAVGNTSLTAGGTTTVTVTVTAENGAVKEYAIQVTRASDPNYVKSSNAELESLSVDGFLLSPAFATDVTRYFLWLPYEQTSVTVKADAAHDKAAASVANDQELIPGQAVDIAVTVTAEDGTTKVYTLTVFRAPAHEDTDAFLSGERAEAPTEPTEPPTEPVTEPSTEPATEPATEPQPTEPPVQPEPESNSKPAILIATGCICLVCGAAIGVLVSLLIRRKQR